MDGNRCRLVVGENRVHHQGPDDVQEIQQECGGLAMLM